MYRFLGPSSVHLVSEHAQPALWHPYNVVLLRRRDGTKDERTQGGKGFARQRQVTTRTNRPFQRQTLESPYLEVGLAAEVGDVLHDVDLLLGLDDPALHDGIVECGGRVGLEPLQPLHARRRGPRLTVGVVALVQVHLTHTHVRGGGNTESRATQQQLLEVCAPKTRPTYIRTTDFNC